MYAIRSYYAEKGTTYKLIRKVHGKQEHVHVVGLRGFGGPVAA